MCVCGFDTADVSICALRLHSCVADLDEHVGVCTCMFVCVSQGVTYHCVRISDSLVSSFCVRVLAVTRSPSIAQLHGFYNCYSWQVLAGSTTATAGRFACC